MERRVASIEKGPPKQAALNAGALGCSISGAGPAMFALCQGDEIAFRVGMAMEQAFFDVGIAAKRIISRVNPLGSQRIR